MPTVEETMRAAAEVKARQLEAENEGLRREMGLLMEAQRAEVRRLHQENLRLQERIRLAHAALCPAGKEEPVREILEKATRELFAGLKREAAADEQRHTFTDPLKRTGP